MAPFPAIDANSSLKLTRPFDYDFGGVECLTVLGASLRGALACVRKGPATDEVVPAETEPMLIYDSDDFDCPLFTLDVSLTSSPLPLLLSFRLASNRAFFLSSSYFFFLGSSGSM